MPYAFTEQGISMLSAILRSDVAIDVSIGIMRAFVEMRKFLATNSLILNCVDELEVKQLEYQKTTDICMIGTPISIRMLACECRKCIALYLRHSHVPHLIELGFSPVEIVERLEHEGM